MGHFHKIWIEQCEAAQGIKERYGINKALGYLIGEKLMDFVQAADSDPEFAEEKRDVIDHLRHFAHLLPPPSPARGSVKGKPPGRAAGHFSRAEKGVVIKPPT